MKIAICTPHHGDVTAEYAFSLAKMMLRTGQAAIEFNGEVVAPQMEVFLRSSSVLPQLRNMLVRDALEWGANYILWVDSDQKFRDDALLRLLTLNLPVVGANYPRRLPPHHPTAISLSGELLATTDEAARALAVEPVASLGLGFCLVSATVFDTLGKAAQDRGGEMGPLFAVEMIGDGSQIIGEDVFFFRRLAEANVPVHVDHAVSWYTGHVHSRALGFADLEAPAPGFAPTTIRVSYGRP